MAMDPNITVPQNPSVPNAPPPAQPAPEGPPILTMDDLKHIKTEIISLLTHDIDARAALLSLMLEALLDAEVLTTANFGQLFRADPNVYQRIADTAYQSDVEAERHEPPGA